MVINSKLGGRSWGLENAGLSTKRRKTVRPARENKATKINLNFIL
jgi:hypothetical protein